MQTGILYIALGAPYLEEARRSAASAKASNPGLPIAVITDQAASPDECFDIILPHQAYQPSGDERYLARDRGAYFIKILPLLRSPFERTIFLDTDTWVAGSLQPAFDLMEKYDVLVTPCHITHDYAFEIREEPFRSIPEAFGYFNTGFFAYRRGAASESLIREWQHLYDTEVSRHTVNDQPALRLALYRQPVNFHVIPPWYNTITWAPFIIPGGGRAVMLHGRNPWLQRWAGHFQAARPALVGGIQLPIMLRYHLARALHLIGRKKRQWFGSSK